MVPTVSDEKTDRTKFDDWLDKASWGVFWFLVGGGIFYFMDEILGWN